MSVRRVESEEALRLMERVSVDAPIRYGWFDLPALATTYCVDVISALTTRRLAVAAAIAVSLGGMLPSPHAHLDRERPIVHVHAVADSGISHHDAGAGHDHAAFDHGDHVAAPRVIVAYDLATRFILNVTIAAAVAFEAPASGGMHQPRRATWLPTHDPPLRFTSSPAPPAVV